MGSLTVMVVDDDPIAREVAAEALESVGYRVIRRQAALGTVAAILKRRPDVVLLDVHMPGLSGDGIVRALARRSSGKSTLPILYSADPPDVLNRFVSVDEWHLGRGPARGRLNPACTLPTAGPERRRRADRVVGLAR